MHAVSDAQHDDCAHSMMTVHSHQMVGVDPGDGLVCPGPSRLQSHCCWWSCYWQTSHCLAAPAPPWQTHSMSAAEQTATPQLVSDVKMCICSQSSPLFLFNISTGSPWQTHGMSAAEQTATSQLGSAMQLCICSQMSPAV